MKPRSRNFLEVIIMNAIVGLILKTSQISKTANLKSKKMWKILISKLRDYLKNVAQNVNAK